MARPISAADTQFLDALVSAGFRDVRTRPDKWKRRLEDWRHDGLYPQAERQFPGGGGSNARYSAETVAQVVELAQLMKERARKDEAALLLFYRGRTINEETAKRAHRSLLRRLDAFFSSFSNSNDAFEIAESAALGITRKLHRSKQGRHMLRELQPMSGRTKNPGRHEAAESLLTSALTNGVLVLRSGMISTQDGLLELLQSLRLLLPALGEQADRWEPGWALQQLLQLLACASTPAQQAALERASVADLQRARQDIPSLLGFLRQIAERLPRDSAGRHRLAVPPLSERVAIRLVPALLSAYAALPWLADSRALLRGGAINAEVLGQVARVVMQETPDGNDNGPDAVT